LELQRLVKIRTKQSYDRRGKRGDLNLSVNSLELAAVRIKQLLETCSSRKPDVKEMDELGYLLLVTGEFRSAEIVLKNRLQKYGDDDVASQNLGISLLSQKKFYGGWKHFEKKPMNWNLDWLRPNWIYGSELDGKEFIVIADEGIGDTLMFAGMIKELQNIARVSVIVCDKKLLTTIAKSFNNVRVVNEVTEDVLKAAPNIIRLSSLASYFRRDEDAFSNKKEWLSPDVGLEAEDAIVNCDDKRLVGFAYRSNSEDAIKRSTRNLNLADFARIIKQTDAKWVSLQCMANKEELQLLSELSGKRVEMLKTEEMSVEEIIACVRRLGCVVTNEQTTVHLAGVTNTKCIVLRGKPHGWRYIQKEGDDNRQMLWYESVWIREANEITSLAPEIMAMLG